MLLGACGLCQDPISSQCTPLHRERRTMGRLRHRGQLQKLPPPPAQMPHLGFLGARVAGVKHTKSNVKYVQLFDAEVYTL